MSQFLPPALLKLFAPRDPIKYLPPPDKLPHEKKTSGYQGVANYIQFFEDPSETPPPTKVETREERRERLRRIKQEEETYKLEKAIAIWDPHENENATKDPYKTIFVGRLDYDTTEAKIRRAFEEYGTIKQVILVNDKETGKFKGYAFVEYVHERDMREAYKRGHRRKIDGREIVVDVERGRTVKGWLPRRLGGGLRSRPGDRPRDTSRDRHRSRYRRSHSREKRRSRSRSNHHRHRHSSREDSLERSSRRKHSTKHHRDYKLNGDAPYEDFMPPAYYMY